MLCLISLVANNRNDPYSFRKRITFFSFWCWMQAVKMVCPRFTSHSHCGLCKTALLVCFTLFTSPFRDSPAPVRFVCILNYGYIHLQHVASFCGGNNCTWVNGHVSFSFIMHLTSHHDAVTLSPRVPLPCLVPSRRSWSCFRTKMLAMVLFLLHTPVIKI